MSGQGGQRLLSFGVGEAAVDIRDAISRNFGHGVPGWSRRIWTCDTTACTWPRPWAETLAPTRELTTKDAQADREGARADREAGPTTDRSRGIVTACGASPGGDGRTR